MSAEEEVNHALGRPWSVSVDTGDRMYAGIVERINRKVTTGDRLVLVGDVVTAGTANQARRRTHAFLERLTCKDVHLVKGNHDCLIPQLGLTDDVSPQGRADWLDVIRSLYRTVTDSCMFACHAGILIWSSHYPHLTWPGASRTGVAGVASPGRVQTMHVYGHVHDKYNKEEPVKYPDRWCAVNVGVDGNPNWPLRDDEIYSILEPRRIRMIQHVQESKNG